MSTQPVLVCNGRQYDTDGRPAAGPDGEPCGRIYPNVEGGTWSGRAYSGPNWSTSAAERELESDARAVGWRLGPRSPNGQRDVMCPACAKPDTRTAAICRDLEKSTKR